VLILGRIFLRSSLAPTAEFRQRRGNSFSMTWINQ